MNDQSEAQGGADDAIRKLADGKLLLDFPASGVARLTICNPAKRNALDHPILDALNAAIGALAAGRSDAEARPAAEGQPAAQPDATGTVRSLILTGSDGMFSAGYDIGEIPDQGFQERAEMLVAHPFTEAIEALERFPYPTLAALSGHTIGGGLELALACDLRLAADGIKLGMPPAKLGLVYSHTGLRRFLDTIGAPRTRELFFIGRNIDADMALRWGLVNRLCEGDQLASTAVQLAAEIAGNAPLSLSGNKRIIAELLAARARLEQSLEQELIELRESSFASADLREGMLAFAEKRKPRFQGR